MVPRTGLRRRLPPPHQRATPRVRGDVRRRVPRAHDQSRPRAADVHPAADRHRHRRRRPRNCARRRPARAHRGVGIGGGRGDPRLFGVRRLARVAQFFQGRAVRRQGPALPARRRLLRLPAAHLADAPTRSARHDGRRVARLRAVLRPLGQLPDRAALRPGVLAARPPDSCSQAPLVAPRRGALHRAGLGHVARDSPDAARALVDRARRVVRRLAREDSLPLGDVRGARRRRRARHLAWLRTARLADSGRGGPRARRDDHRRHLHWLRPGLHRHAQRARQGTAVHHLQHRGHAQGLRARSRGRAGADGRRGAQAGEHRRQRRHRRERPAVGLPAAAPDVRADSGNPDVLRLRGGRQRPLRDRWQVSPGHALGPRAEHREHAESIVGQRAAVLHARLRPHARAGQPGHDRRSAGTLHP